MATPARRKRSGNYQFRKATPKDIWEARKTLAAHGIKVTREVTQTLSTSSSSDAKRRQAKLTEQWEARWHAYRQLLRDGPVKFTAKQLAATTGDIARQLLAGDLSANDDDELVDVGHSKPLRVSWESTAEVFELMAQYKGPLPADTLALLDALIDRGLGRLPSGPVFIDQETRGLLRSRLITDLPKQARLLSAMREGDYSVPKWLKGRPQTKEAFAKPVTFSSLIEGWASSDRQPKDDSVRHYVGKVKAFTEWLGHDDAAKVKREDVRSWRDVLLSKPGRNQNGAKQKIDALRTILRWGIANDRLPYRDNPTDGLTVSLKNHPKQVREFTDDEARTILSASRRQSGFLRWGPWLLAYTGARAGEIGQLRVADLIKNASGGWAVRITEEAGKLKNKASERTVPLHSAVLAEGFGAYVEGLDAEGRLFPELFDGLTGAEGEVTRKTIRQVISRSRYQLRRMFDGIEGFKLPDSRAIQHSWRHRMTTLMRTYCQKDSTRDAMLGHAGQGVDGGYGSRAALEIMRQEIELIPPLDLPSLERDGLRVRAVPPLKAHGHRSSKVRLTPKQINRRRSG